MATVAEARAALVDQLDDEGIRAHPTYPGTLNAPAVVVVRRTTTADTAPGIDDPILAARVFVPWASGNEVAQERLDDLVASVVAAIREDPTLGGVVDSARVSEVETDDLVEYPPGAGVRYLSANVVIEVLL